ncbi:3D domain-containing protein [Alteribacillus sp. JSM 102045]|uniref:3D domain-containing protein n=1 Tax=Alteribacillus sp. JSM 102045 TaxID=1562101 RepID=UPI0035C09261
MEKKITIYRRLSMTLFFVIAVTTTLSFVTNVKAQELPGYFYEYFKTEYTNDKRISDVPEKQGTNHFKRGINEEGQEPAFNEEAEILFEAEGPTEMVTATGYTAGYESTGKTEEDPAYGITYSGVKVRRDQVSTIAADPKYFPIGTVLYIPEYGYGIVADTGSSIKGKKLDLYYDTVEEVYDEWGKRNVKVYVLKKGDGTLREKDLMALNKEGALPVVQQSPSFGSYNSAKRGSVLSGF